MRWEGLVSMELAMTMSEAAQNGGHLLGSIPLGCVFLDSRVDGEQMLMLAFTFTCEVPPSSPLLEGTPLDDLLDCVDRQSRGRQVDTLRSTSRKQVYLTVQQVGSRQPGRLHKAVGVFG